ncbi:MAG: helix-turn-helix transcriptional regulator [Deltaproteobacteria bacterium]|nr:helix-turn-helix transcriptional regulator [Deltaproteobacteria bacterium]
MTEHSETSFLPLSARDFHILFVLACGDGHGYGLVKAIEAQTDGLIRLDPANLYRAIQRMVDSGLVEDTEPPADGSGERRRYYKITEHGRRVVSADAERMRSLARAAEAARLISKSGRVS